MEKTAKMCICAFVMSLCLVFNHKPVNAEEIEQQDISVDTEEQELYEASINTKDITLYGLSSSYDGILSIPSDLKTEFRITVSGAKNVSYEVTEGDNITVDNSGTVKIAYKTWYYNGNGVWSTQLSDGETATKTSIDFDEGDAVVTVNADGVNTKVTVHVKDYAEKYADDKIQKYIDENIKGKSLSDTELMEKIAGYPAGFDYGSGHSGYVTMTIFGDGDCWASTSAIIRICDMLGIEAWARNGNKDLGAGGGHMNAMVFYNGNYYEIEAGYDAVAPRPYYIDKRDSLFCFHRNDDDTFNVYQYDGNETSPFKLNIPEDYNGKKVTEIAESFSRGSNRELCKEIYLPGSIRKIGDYAFTSYDELTTINIPASLEEIGTMAFAQSLKLTNFNCDPSNKNFSAQDGILYNKDKTSIVSAPAVNNPSIPASVNTIGSGAFSYNSNLTKITLPENVKTIEDEAFYECYALGKIYIKSADISIGDHAFGDCTNLIIYGVPGSDAQKYAKENGLVFRDISEAPRNGLYHDEDGWNYYVDDEISEGTTTLVKYNGFWWYVRNGKIDFGATGLCKYNGSWWYVQNGRVNFSANTLVKYNGSWWYVSGGRVNFSAAGLCKYNGTWWYINGGRVNFNATGLCKYNGSWWYVSGGRVNFSATGLCKYNGSWWYVSGGRVNFSATGLCKYNGSWWYVQNGRVNFNATTLCKYNGTWWYIQNGRVNFNTVTLCRYGNNWYAVAGGKVAWGYTGNIKYNGGTFRVVNGIVRF